MFFISLAAGEWAAPRGPSAWGYYWVPGLVAAIIVALVLASATPISSTKKQLLSRSTETINEASASIAAAVLGIFFWILIVVLAIIAIAGLAGRM